MKSKIRIVLVETSHPGNIGAVARAMKNMNLDQLFLVNPKEYPSSVATARASGADDVLGKAVVCQNLQEAIGDCHTVIGASARLRAVEWPMLSPRECARIACENSVHESVAVIFGREDSGLSNAELDKCQYLVHIPTNPDYQSLNIAAAVQVISYEIYLKTLEKSEQPFSQFQSRASADEMDGFFTHMELALTEIGFLKPPSCQKLLRRLRRLFNRAAPDQTDINILRGVLSAAQGRKYNWKSRKNKNDSMDLE